MLMKVCVCKRLGLCVCVCELGRGGGTVKGFVGGLCVHLGTLCVSMRGFVCVHVCGRGVCVCE